YEMFLVPPTILPRQWTLASYAKLFASIPFWHYYLNSVSITVVYTLVALLISSLAGFALAKYRFRGHEVVFSAVILTLMIPIYALIIPLYALITRFGWMDTYVAVIVPFAANGLTTFFMRQSMLGIPDALMDAARIDGATEFGIFWKVALPVSKPSLVVCAILLATYAWNDFLWPLVVLRSSGRFTVPIALANFMGLYSVDYASIMAGSVLATVPVLVLFLALQRYFLAGLLAGAVKQ
ncbi:MAG: carbohydrate ABC transporter permease, partial [Firmicutes bacterium]|nr:carbohydrate ABC transporter permease [Bacillota bacterium]